MDARDIPPIYFYLPAHRRPSAPIPEEVPRGYVDNMSDAFFCNTSLNWTLQTYLRLREHSYPCQLVEEIPEEGIVVALGGDLPFTVKPSKENVFVALMGDGGWCPYTQVHVRQNPKACQCQLDGVRNTFCMQHWTQPGLIPRDEERGDILKNVGYFGHPSQLANPLHGEEWEHFLAEHDLNWIPVHEGSDRQCDYSDIDLIVAIRSFDGRSYDYKPATKLHNAWLAGVPAILGPESAYRAERRDERDYLEARSYDELRKYVITLKRNPKLRRALRERSEENRERINPEEKVRQWWKLLTGPVQEIYERWTSRSILGRGAFLASRWLRVKRNALQERLDG